MSQPRIRITNVGGSGDGTPGDPGASAYQVAVNNGFIGTEQEWLESLVGPAGADGADGAPGPKGDQGDPGIGIPTGGTGGQILAKIDDTNYSTEWIDNWATYSGYTAILKHEVKAGVALTKGQAVYVSSADGTNMIVSKASNASEQTSSKTMGLIETSVSLNGKANVITEGLLAGLNTNGATEGDPVWLGTNGNLIYGLANKPVAPAHLVFIGIVTRANQNNGEIFIRPQNGFELNELHDVLIGSGYASTPTDKDLIAYESSSGLWKNKTFSELGIQTRISGVTDTEIGYLDGVTSAIQTQLDSKSTASKSETLSNKSISLATNTLTGSTAQFNTALNDDNFVTINGYDYPKNKSFDRTNRLMGAYNAIAGFDTNQGDYGPVDTSSPVIYIGGSTANSNFSLPSTSSLNYGEALTIVNTSSVSINIKTNSGTLVNVLDAGHVWKYTYSNATGTGVVGGWMSHQIGFSDGRITLSATSVNETDPLVIKSKNGHGGATFGGIATLINTGTGATNINKFIRINPTGGLEIINSAYSANIFTLADSGDVSGINNLTTNGTINGVSLNNNAWTSFTPALSTESGTWTLGNGSIEAAYKLIGKTCHFRAKVVIGSTTSIGAGTLNIGLPFTAATANYQFPVSLLDAGNAWYQATANGMYLNNTSKFAMISYSGSGKTASGVTNSSPFSFLDGDYISVSGTYEIA